MLCFDVSEVKIYLNLFIGDEMKPRWHEEPHDDDNKKYFRHIVVPKINSRKKAENFRSCGQRYGCMLRLFVVTGSLNYIKVSRGRHHGHAGTNDRAIRNALHFITSDNIADGIGVPEE
uniref:Uncharacterized protein n=1 Tax=Meloidogyne floridensis TaxID=298350 RepID=A0A915P8Q3_9BILA